jgi:hypothetical protein
LHIGAIDTRGIVDGGVGAIAIEEAVGMEAGVKVIPSVETLTDAFFPALAPSSLNPT